MLMDKQLTKRQLTKWCLSLLSTALIPANIMEGDTVSGDNVYSFKSANFGQADGGNQLKGALAFGVDMSNPQAQLQLVNQRTPERFDAEPFAQTVGQIRETGANSAIKMSNEGPIAAISLPPGWTEDIPGQPPPGTYAFRVTPPGTYAFRVTNGHSFVPPDHIGNPSVAIHVGADRDPVPPQAEAALRQVLQSKRATEGAQPLTAAEFASVAAVIGAQDGGNNQFHDLGTHGPKFNVTNASTVNIQGRTALLVEGNFVNPNTGAPGLARESIFIDSNQGPGTTSGGIEQIYLQARPEKIKQYEKPFWDTINTIQWAYHP